jgi:hypothetical protein
VLAAAIDRCLEPDPADRPTITQLADTLDGLLAQGRKTAGPHQRAQSFREGDT